LGFFSTLPVIVKPDTVIRWHRKGFRLYWRSISKRGPGRPPISEEAQALIRRLADENSWGGRKIQAELEKPGFTVSLVTVRHRSERFGTRLLRRQLCQRVNAGLERQE
jgi:hypothetical protein